MKVALQIANSLEYASRLGFEYRMWQMLIPSKMQLIVPIAFLLCFLAFGFDGHFDFYYKFTKCRTRLHSICLMIRDWSLNSPLLFFMSSAISSDLNSATSSNSLAMDIANTYNRLTSAIPPSSCQTLYELLHRVRAKLGPLYKLESWNSSLVLSTDSVQFSDEFDACLSDLIQFRVIVKAMKLEVPSYALEFWRSFQMFTVRVFELVNPDFLAQCQCDWFIEKTYFLNLPSILWDLEDKLPDPKIPGWDYPMSEGLLNFSPRTKRGRASSDIEPSGTASVAEPNLNKTVKKPKTLHSVQLSKLDPAKAAQYMPLPVPATAAPIEAEKTGTRGRGLPIIRATKHDNKSTKDFVFKHPDSTETFTFDNLVKVNRSLAAVMVPNVIAFGKSLKFAHELGNQSKEVMAEKLKNLLDLHSAYDSSVQTYIQAEKTAHAIGKSLVIAQTELMGTMHDPRLILKYLEDEDPEFTAGSDQVMQLAKVLGWDISMPATTTSSSSNN
ncbi:hypothetical protein BDP27DRAFT_1369938 [Rhodocollybia butyracea]|uniref:Uncharacterized protein n=1 Tax=Rhodocollybia butyracea TaxID=206335 RepID=A0A9P5PC44_9AGAR|nr:hypothetical protein BDP27DRAFT_1369938 [Rhodocollybia butyracea]